MPRFLMVVQIDVSSGCWQRLKEVARVALGQAAAFATILSSTPSVTRKITSCGVSPAVLLPRPGVGMLPFRVESAPAISVPWSVVGLAGLVEEQPEKTQLWWSTGITAMLETLVPAVVGVVSVASVFKLRSNV